MLRGENYEKRVVDLWPGVGAFLFRFVRQLRGGHQRRRMAHRQQYLDVSAFVVARQRLAKPVASVGLGFDDRRQFRVGNGDFVYISRDKKVKSKW